MSRQSNYDKFPYVPVGSEQECSVGWRTILAQLAPHLKSDSVLCIECYPGAFVDLINEGLFAGPQASQVMLSEDCLKAAAELYALPDPLLGTDPIFGHMTGICLEDYFDAESLKKTRAGAVQLSKNGPVVVLGTGASLIAPENSTLVYADLARWEIQQRWRRKQIGNFGLNNAEAKFASKYKCGFFAEWRAPIARNKHSTLASISFST